MTTAAAGGFTAVIDGKSWVATDSSIRVSLLNGILTISGQSSDGQTITILLEDTVQRPYTLNENSVSMATYFDEQDNSTLEFRYLSTNQSYNASLSGGAVLLNEVDNLNKTISGIFSFNVYIDSANYRKVITEGLLQTCLILILYHQQPQPILLQCRLMECNGPHKVSVSIKT